MKSKNIEPDKRTVRRADRIKVARYRPDFENPDHLPKRESARIRREKLPGIWFINPIARVHAECDSPEFFEVARKRQGEWFRHLTRRFNNGWRRERESDLTTIWQRAYGYDGVIVINSILLPFESWVRERKNNRFLT